MDQRFEPLTPADAADLEAKRTSISQRIERGEEVEIHQLFESACSAIERLRSEGV